MKRRIKLLIFSIGALMALHYPAHAQTPAQQGQGVELKYLDNSVKPCQNFWQYANGTWLANTAIPNDRSSWGAGSELNEKNQQLLHTILEETARDTSQPKESVIRKVGDYYRIGMDTAKIEADGAKPLAAEFARIAAIKDSRTLIDELARLHRHNIGPLFSFGAYQDFKNSSESIAQLYQGGLGLPDRDYYINDDEQTQKIRKEYLTFITKMFELLGDKPTQAAAQANTVMAIETRLAKASMTQVEQRDPNAIYHKMNLTELTALTPAFSWQHYFNAVGLAKPGDINVGQPEFFREAGKMIGEVSIEDWKTYLRWNLINASAERLSDDFVNANFNFYGKTINGTKEISPRWKRVLNSTDALLGEALGQLFVARAFSPEAKARALTMVNNLKAALRDRLLALDWITEDTRKEALRKLDAIVVKVGYPDKWRDYSALPIDQNSYVLNAMQAEEFEFTRNLNKIGKPVDRTEWGMTAPTVNAYYNPTFNEIVFPAGILQPPFFDANADDATNYGGMGGVIGHELTHGFDDQGRQFDADGNLKNWWTEQDIKNYTARAAEVEKQFSEFVAIDELHINGKLTLGENIADLGGVKIAYLAFQKSLAGKPHPPKIDGFTAEQRFFLAYAQGWRRNIRPEALRLMIATNPHSPPKFRVLGPLSNLPEFYQAFDCPSGESTRAENLRVQIW